MNIERAYTTLLRTVQALASHKPDELWEPLLASAVEVVPGAEVGTILLRFGGLYRVVAHLGYSSAALGLEFSQESVLAGYGDPLQWQQGQPRIASGETLQHLIREALTQPNTLAGQRSLEHPNVQSVKANLCLPVLLSGKVVAYINLDNRSSETAFDQRSIEIARLYALQVTALLAAQHERAELETRVRELEAIESLSRAIQSEVHEHRIVNHLAQEVSSYLDSPHVDVLLLHENGQLLQPKSSLGIFQRYKDNSVPKGKGLSWASLQSEEILHVEDVRQDKRIHLPEGFSIPALSQISAPMYDSKGGPLGVIHAARDLPRSFSIEEIRLLKVMVNVVTAALERVRAVKSLQQQLRQSQTLLHTVEVLGHENPQPVWQELLVAAVELVPGAQAGSLWVKDVEGKGYRMVAQQGYGDELLGSWLGPEILDYWFGETRHLQKGLPRIGTSRFVRQAMQHNRAHASPEQLQVFYQIGRVEQIQSTLCQPIILNEQILAYINLDNFEEETALGEASVRAAQSFALQVAALLAAQRSRSEREEAYEGSLRAIGVALEARDLETAVHTDRVASLAIQVGSELGLAPADLRQLRWGSYLHDIGKLAVPDSILLKPGSLSREEFEAMQTHCEKGYGFSRNLPFLPEDARKVILYHHERWNGRGYPSGLQGQAIPQLARIFSVCDVFDALVSKRPYKPAWSLTEAIAEIANQAGEQFDPQVVAAFLKVVGRNHPLLQTSLESASVEH